MLSTRPMSLTPVEWTAHFKRAYKKKPPDMQAVIRAAVTQLRTDWTYPGLRTHPVLGCSGVFEARLDRGNRLTFHWEGDTIVLRNHCNHQILDRRP
jgi:hypothetical protein